MVNGIDTSHYETVTNWSNILGSGYKFDFTKATQGSSFDDPTFTTYMPAGKAAGLWMSGYDFACPATDSSVGCTATNATTEADHYLSIAAPYFSEGYMFPSLDLEEGCGIISDSAMSTWVDMWMSTVQQYISAHDNYSGVTPLLYTGVSEVTGCLDTYLTEWPLWIANWGVGSPTTGIWSNWTFWQYSDSGTVSGISGSADVDLDHFAGDRAELLSGYVFGNATTATPTLSAFTVSPSHLTLGSQLTMTTNASGGAGPLTYTYKGLPPGCTSQNVSSWSCTPSATGSYTLRVFVNDSASHSVNATANITVAPPGSGATRYTVLFSVNHAACAPIFFNGTEQTNQTTASFLSGTYQAHAPVCAGHPFLGWTYRAGTGAGAGGPTPWMNLSVSSNGTLWANYTASPSALTATLTASPTEILAGASTTLTPSVSGGQNPYSCVWALNGTNTTETGCTARTFTYDYPGTYDYAVWASDSVGHIAKSNEATVWVDAVSATQLEKVDISPTVAQLSTGGTQTFTAVPTCSPAPCPATVVYSWTLSVGIGTLNATSGSTVEFTATASGGTSLSVTGVIGGQSQSASAAITVGVCTLDCSSSNSGNAGFLGLGLVFTAELVGLVLLVIIVVVVVVVLAGRRKGGSPPPTSVPAPGYYVPPGGPPMPPPPGSPPAWPPPSM